MDGPVELRCFPASDEAFAAAAARALAETGRRAGASLAEAVEARLRAAYPAAVIHPRSWLAAPVGETRPVWYVYRDGHYVVGEHDPVSRP
ncbi:MAG TPA: hypothetical protein VF763_13580 [Candidatus Limnocylindrales bacterium]